MGKKTLHIIYNIKTWGPFCRGDDESCPYLRFVSLSDQRCLIFDGLNGSRPQDEPEMGNIGRPQCHLKCLEAEAKE